MHGGSLEFANLYIKEFEVRRRGWRGPIAALELGMVALHGISFDPRRIAALCRQAGAVRVFFSDPS